MADNLDIRRVAFTVADSDATKTILAGIAGKVIRIISLMTCSEAAAADFFLDDEDDVALSARIHQGTGSGGAKHDRVMMPYNPFGWAESPVGVGLKVRNEDGAAFSFAAVLRVMNLEDSP